MSKVDYELWCDFVQGMTDGMTTGVPGTRGCQGNDQEDPLPHWDGIPTTPAEQAKELNEMAHIIKDLDELHAL